MNWNHSAALACYLDLADLPPGTVYVTDVRPDRTVYLVMAWSADPYHYDANGAAVLVGAWDPIVT